MVMVYVFSVRLDEETRRRLEEMAASNYHKAADELRKIINQEYDRRQAQSQPTGNK